MLTVKHRIAMKVENVLKGPKPKPKQIPTVVSMDEILVSILSGICSASYLESSMTSQQQYEVHSQSEHLSDEFLA